MRSITTAALALSTLFVTGCQPTISGTWNAAPNQTAGKMTFGAMTLASDGTFTAEAKYDDKSEVMSGYYTFTGDKLTFEAGGQKRVYDAKLTGNCLSVTHKGKTVKMCKLGAKCKASCKSCKKK